MLLVTSMSVEEFKAWLDGFGESIKGSPTKAQWDKIKLRLESVSGTAAVNYYTFPERTWWPKWVTVPNIDLTPKITWDVDTVCNMNVIDMARKVGTIEAQAS